MKEKFTIMLPVNRNNLKLANNCINHLLKNCDLNIIVIDDNGFDEDYVIDSRITYLHNNTTERQPLVKIWNQCIKECPTENVIIASWRQRPNNEHFEIIDQKLKEGYGMVTFDELHFFSFSKHLMTVIGFFDEGFTKGQYEDTDWWNRLKTNDIGIYVGYVPEERYVDNTYVQSTWLEGNHLNKMYYTSKWTEDIDNKRLVQHNQEINFSDRLLYNNVFENRSYKKWDESVLSPNLVSYFNTYNGFLKNF
jgi:hypothetical protein